MSDQAWKKHSILIVDDEKAVVDTIHLALKLDGFTCRVAMSGEAALMSLEDQPAPLIMSDYAMAPGMNGVQFLQEVRARYPDAVTMILSAHAEPQIILDAVNDAGAFQYLVKPYTNDDLILRVSQALKFYHARYEIAKLAQAKKALLQRMAHQENASIMGSFSKALSEKFSDTVTELIWGATHETLGMSIRSRSRHQDPKTTSRVHLATILKKLSRIGHYTDFIKYGQYQAVPITALLGELIDQAKFAASHASMELTIVDDFSAAKDLSINMLPDLLSLGFRAVLENAMIHRDGSSAPCQISVSCRCRDSDDGKVVDVDVRDNGIGVRDLDDDIFSPLITSMTEQPALGAKIPKLSEYNLSGVGHVGLGLTLARWAITKHDGDISLIESSRSGSLFQITLPLV